MARLALLLLAVCGYHAMLAVAQSCSDAIRCSECVFDSSAGVGSCSWCAATSSCMNASSAATQCPQAPLVFPSAKCDDMSCGLANFGGYGNVYLCRPGMIISLLVAIGLFVFSVGYFFWMRAIQQRPWRFGNIHDVVDKYGSIKVGDASPKLIRTVTQGEFPCPMCHLHYPGEAFGPGAVSFWCTVARWSIIPFHAGITAASVSIFTLASVSLKPWFADWYYALMLTGPAVLFTGFLLIVFFARYPVVGDERQRPTMFISLAILLRGRRLEDVFGIAEESPATSTAAAAAASVDAASSTAITVKAEPAAPSTPALTMVELQSATSYLINLETSVPKSFRERLQDELKPGEVVCWYEKPHRSHAFVEHRWLIHMCITFFCGAIWMFALSNVSPLAYPTLLLPPTTMRALAVILLLFSAVMVVAVTSGLTRLYVMTNSRILIFLRGTLGSTHVTITPLDSIIGATVVGYQELGYSLLTFAWDTKAAAVRRMPSIKTNRFVGVQDIEKLLAAFHRVAPPLKSEKAKQDLQHHRLVWSLAIFVQFVLLELTPIFVVGSGVLPLGASVTGMLLALSMIVCIIQRGVRTFATTTSHLSSAKDWSKFSDEGFQLKNMFGFLLKDGFLQTHHHQAAAKPASPTTTTAAKK